MNHSLQVLGAIEMLLLLKEERVRYKRQASSRLTVCWVRERDAFIISEIRRIVSPFSALLHAVSFAAVFAGPSLAPWNMVVI